VESEVVAAFARLSTFGEEAFTRVLELFCAELPFEEELLEDGEVVEDIFTLEDDEAGALVGGPRILPFLTIEDMSKSSSGASSTGLGFGAGWFFPLLNLFNALKRSALFPPIAAITGFSSDSEVDDQLLPELELGLASLRARSFNFPANISASADKSGSWNFQGVGSEDSLSEE
jgi:hypothetical protein